MTNDEQVDALLARAEVLIDAGRSGDALPLIREARVADPQSARVYCLAALAYINLGDWSTAREAASAAAQRQPDDEWAHRLLAVILLNTGAKKRALHAAEAAVQIAPESREALHVLASCQWENRRRKAAEETLERLARLAPDWAPTFELLSLPAIARRDWTRAEAYLRRELELDPTSEAAMRSLGEVLRRQRRSEEAIACFHQAARLSPNVVATRVTLRGAVGGYLFDEVYGIRGFFRAVYWWILACAVTAISWRISGEFNGGMPRFPLEPVITGISVLALITYLTALVVRALRMRRLHPQVARFYQDQRRRERREWLLRLPFIPVACYFGLYGIGYLCVEGVRSLDPHAGGHALWLLLIAVALVMAQRLMRYCLTR